MFVPIEAGTSPTARLVLFCLLHLISEQVMEPVRSRCLCVRVPGPSDDQIRDVFAAVGKKEGFTLPSAFAQRLVVHANRNLRRALLTLEVCKVGVVQAAGTA